MINFVNGNLRPVKSDVDEHLSSWYKDNSRVYVSGDHACWSNPELNRKVMKRRFGNVIRSNVSSTGLAGMMQEHFADVKRYVEERVSLSPRLSDGGFEDQDEKRGNGRRASGNTTEDDNRMV